MASFYGHFIEWLSKTAEPFHMLKHKNVRLLWGDAQQTSFEQLKEALPTIPVLQTPDFSSKSTLVCDASDIISAILHQKKGERTRHLSPTVIICYLLQRRDI
jgi:hypothetical protein